MADYNSSHSGATIDEAITKGSTLPAITGGDADKLLEVNVGETAFKLVAKDSTGADHSYIDQDVTSGSSPNFTNAVPTGLISMWSGSIATIPATWYLCDGNNGTPDLTDRFVIHADADSGGTNDVDDTGGSNTISEAELPSHTHDDGTLATDSDSHDHSFSDTTSSDSHSHGDGTLSTNTTGDHNHHISLGGSAHLEHGGYVYAPHLGSSSNTGTDGDHSHTISGNTDSDSHTHSVSGDTDSDTHSHGVGGDTGSTGSGSDYKPRYYALAYIMKG